MGFNNDGAEVVAARLAERAATAAAVGRIAVLGRQHRQDQGRARGRRGRRARRLRQVAPGCSRRTPTTSSSTSARRTPRGCATCRPSTGCEPLLDDAVRRVAERYPLLRQDRPRPRRRRRRSTSPTWPLRTGLDGIIATNTTISPRRAAHPGRRGRGDRRRRPVRAPRSPSARSRCCGCCKKAGRRRAHADLASAASRPPSDARERLDAGATLVQAYTGVRLRRPALAAPDRPGARRRSVSRGPRPRHRRGAREPQGRRLPRT